MTPMDEPQEQPQSVDRAIMAFATRLRVEGMTEDAEQVEACAASLREMPTKIIGADLYDTLATMRDSAAVIVDLIERHSG
jgi:hypothetical protein